MMKTACPRLYEIAEQHYDGELRVIQEWITPAGELGFYTDDQRDFLMALRVDGKIRAARFELSELDAELYRADIYMSIAGADQFGERTVLVLNRGDKATTIMIGDKNKPFPEAAAHEA